MSSSHANIKPSLSISTLSLAVTWGISFMMTACSSIPSDVPPGPEAVKGQGTLLERMGQDQQTITAIGPSTSADIARAQCFVQHAYSELHEGDRSGFVELALDQAEGIVQAHQLSQPSPPTQTINNPVRMRQDLWDRVNALPKDRCAPINTGCIEVQLVRAGHEYTDLGWRHANSYFAIAEDMLAQAEQSARQCAAQPVAPARVEKPAPTPTPPELLEPKVVAPVEPAPVPTMTLSIGAKALFNFDKYQRRDVLTPGRQQIEAAIATIQSQNLSNVRIHIKGYADPLGRRDYNLALALKRANTVKALMIENGINASSITVESAGATDQFAQCSRRLSPSALKACLEPNRRVVIDFTY